MKTARLVINATKNLSFSLFYNVRKYNEALNLFVKRVESTGSYVPEGVVTTKGVWHIKMGEALL